MADVKNHEVDDDEGDEPPPPLPIMVPGVGEQPKRRRSVAYEAAHTVVRNAPFEIYSSCAAVQADDSAAAKRRVPNQPNSLRPTQPHDYEAPSSASEMTTRCCCYYNPMMRAVLGLSIDDSQGH